MIRGTRCTDRSDTLRFNYSFPMEPIDQVTADGEKVVREGKSSGGEGSTATSVEVFTFAAGGVAPKKIRYTGLGNRREKNGRGIFIGDTESIYYSSAIADMYSQDSTLSCFSPVLPPPFSPIVMVWKP